MVAKNNEKEMNIRQKEQPSRLTCRVCQETKVKEQFKKGQGIRRELICKECHNTEQRKQYREKPWYVRKTEKFTLELTHITCTACQLTLPVAWFRKRDRYYVQMCRSCGALRERQYRAKRKKIKINLITL
jgi:hypothetical protein